MLVRNFEDIFNLNEEYSKTAEGFHVEFSLHNVTNSILLSSMTIFILGLCSTIVTFLKRCDHTVWLQECIEVLATVFCIPVE